MNSSMNVFVIKVLTNRNQDAALAIPMSARRNCGPPRPTVQFNAQEQYLSRQWRGSLGTRVFGTGTPISAGPNNSFAKHIRNWECSVEHNA